MNDRGRRADRISSPQVDTPGDVWSSPLPFPAVVSPRLTAGEPDGGGFPELQLALPEDLWPEEPAEVVVDTPTGRIGALPAPLVSPPTLRPRPPGRSRRPRSRKTVALAALASTAAVAVVGLVMAGASNRAPSQLQAGLPPSTVTTSIPRVTVPAGVLGAATTLPTVAVDPAAVPAEAAAAAPSAAAPGAAGTTTGVTATTRPVPAASGATSPPVSAPSPAQAPAAPAAPAAAPAAPDRSIAPPVPSSVSPPAPQTPDVTTTAVTQAPRRDRPSPPPEITTTTAPPPPPATGPTTTVVGPLCLGGDPLVPIPCA